MTSRRPGHPPGVMVGADHRAHVLGVEPRRKLGRADQVTEQHRQLPTLGFRRRRSGCGLGWGAQFCLRCGSRLGQGGNRLEQLAPVPDGGDANILEIVSSQFGQDLGVNLVLPKSSRSQAAISTASLLGMVMAWRKLPEWRIRGHQSVRGSHSLTPRGYSHGSSGSEASSAQPADQCIVAASR
jgi:hypothetical protein